MAHCIPLFRKAIKRINLKALPRTSIEDLTFRVTAHDHPDHPKFRDLSVRRRFSSYISSHESFAEEPYFIKTSQMMLDTAVEKVVFCPIKPSLYDGLTPEFIQFYNHNTQTTLSNPICNQQRLELLKKLSLYGFEISQQFPILKDIFATLLPQLEYFSDVGASIYNIISREHDIMTKESYIRQYKTSIENNDSNTLPNIKIVKNQHKYNTTSIEQVTLYNQNKQNKQFLVKYFEKMADEIDTLETQKVNLIQQIHYNYNNNNDTQGQLFFNQLLAFASKDRTLWLNGVSGNNTVDVPICGGSGVNTNTTDNITHNLTNTTTTITTATTTAATDGTDTISKFLNNMPLPTFVSQLRLHTPQSLLPWLLCGRFSPFAVMYLLQVAKAHSHTSNNTTIENKTDTIMIHNIHVNNQNTTNIPQNSNTTHHFRNLLTNTTYIVDRNTNWEQDRVAAAIYTGMLFIVYCVLKFVVY